MVENMCVCVCAYVYTLYLSCYIAGFDLLDHSSIDDVVDSVFGHTCLTQETPTENK